MDKPLDIRGANFIKFRLIKSATHDFHESMILGEGGFAVVYKGVINDKIQWAVKRAKENKSDARAFRQEVENLGQIRHVNLVELIGYTFTKSNEQIIVLEYMSGGNLYDRLHDLDNPLPLKQRLLIAQNAAEGINYLHKFTRNGIVHRDIKSTNILIDSKGSAKVSDFGLSREILSEQLDIDPTTVSDLKVTHIAGTFGYMDPEWFTGDRLGRPVASTRSDVYAFGVVLLEIITGKAALVKIQNETQTLVDAVKCSIRTEGHISIIDRNMNISQQLFIIIVNLTELAIQCCNRAGELRPTMDNVVRTINDITNAATSCNEDHSDLIQLTGDILTHFDQASFSTFQRSSSTNEFTLSIFHSIMHSPL